MERPACVGKSGGEGRKEARTVGKDTSFFSHVHNGTILYYGTVQTTQTWASIYLLDYTYIYFFGGGRGRGEFDSFKKVTNLTVKKIANLTVK